MGGAAGRLTALADLARDAIRRHGMLAGGEAVLVAVSGGADSVALLRVLIALAPTLALRLQVAHVDHGLRDDSARDADFVRALAAEFGLPVRVARVTVDLGHSSDAAARVSVARDSASEVAARVSARRGDSPEAAARAARYAALESLADTTGADRIAVAHTADDQAETVLMRVLQAAGPRGLAGIPAVRGRIIRPLLAARRADIVAALTDEGQRWIEDPTNSDRRFLRNRIRHDVLPALRVENPDIVDGLLRTARLARETTDALTRMALMELSRHAVIDDEAVTLPLAPLQALPPAVAAEMLQQAAARLGRFRSPLGRFRSPLGRFRSPFGSHAPLRAWAHRGLRRVLASPPPRRPFAIGGVVIEVSSGRLRLSARLTRGVETRALAVPGVTALPEVGFAMHATLVGAHGYEIPRDRRRVAFDADRVPDSLVVRARRAGDRLAPFGAGESRVKALLINEKIPRWERHAVPIVEAGGRILWVAGVRRSDAALVGTATRRVLELALVPLADSASGR